MNEIYRAVSSIVVRRQPLLTRATSSNSLQSYHRKPTELLYLLVKKPRKHHAWQFPQGGQDDGETIAQAALRELEEECGVELKVKLVDQEPIGSYQYRFPDGFLKSHKRTDGSIGAKVSFIRADWVSGQCIPDGDEIIDFAWVSKTELMEYIHSDYKNAITSFL
jgi:8-oxo-dGTP pyrophosphatase MutT (NUDIX family)